MSGMAIPVVCCPPRCVALGAPLRASLGPGRRRPGAGGRIQSDNRVQGVWSGAWCGLGEAGPVAEIARQ